jgi:K+-sensing histidine kinase KdpD
VFRCAGESGEEGVLDFFHQQLSFAVERRYLQNSAEADMLRATHARVRSSFSFSFLFLFLSFS